MLILYTLSEDGHRDKGARIEALLARMAAADLSAMGELYELVERDLYAYALSKTADRHTAEDVTHDTLVAIWKSAAQYRAMGKPLAWMFTIEMNLIRRHFAQAGRHIPFDEAIGEESDGGGMAEALSDRAFLDGLLRTLGEEEREIVVLHAVSGLRHREIARLLQKPLSTVLSKYNRAIKRLRLLVIEKEKIQ